MHRAGGVCPGVAASVVSLLLRLAALFSSFDGTENQGMGRSQDTKGGSHAFINGLIQWPFDGIISCKHVMTHYYCGERKTKG